MNKRLMRVSGGLFLIAGLLLMATVLFAGRLNNLPVAGMFIALGTIFTVIPGRKPFA